ncbi:undecaprenyl-diphosphate phosphatase [Trichococcus palustris]|uniref:undecaprenyl-diphosphate phosphatase n=1 Tax=Trichococcus palustris TaxID=140314 RepID=UPI000B357DCC|nr:undecaprenyl-diphosphate phosphatase [Trichococcus palustris]
MNTELIEIIKAIILGIVEGITEWLPISSTGHMILVDEFIRLNLTQEFKDMFLYVIQLGAILAVIVLYFHKLNPFSPTKTKAEKTQTWDIWKKVVVGCLPAAVIGLPLNDWADKHLLNATVVAIALIVYGILFIVVENRNKDKDPHVKDFSDLTYKMAFQIGLFQALSIIPGTSRSGSSILGSMVLGTSRFIATEFSFFMSIPIMFGISFLKIIKFGFHFSGLEATVLLSGMITAFIVSVLAIKFLIGYLKRNDFKAFGWYRIVLGAIVLIYFFIF